MNLIDPSTLVVPEPCICKLDSLQILVCQGEDARNFLQGQVTADLDDIKVGQGALSACLNLQGRAVSSFFLIERQKNLFWLILPTNVLEKTQQSLAKYAVFSQVNIEPITVNVNILGVAGQPEAELKEILTPNIPLPTKRYETNAWGDNLILKLAGTDRYLVITDKNNSSIPLTTHHKGWIIHQLLSTEVLIGAELSEKIIPSNLNYAELGAISHEKGCYRGQEVIARLHFRGESKEDLFLLHAVLDTNENQSEQLINLTGETLRSSDSQQAIGKSIAIIGLNQDEILLLAVCKKTLINQINQGQGSISINTYPLSQLKFLELHYNH